MTNEPQLRCADCKRRMDRDGSGALNMTDHADDCAGARRHVITAEYEVPA